MESLHVIIPAMRSDTYDVNSQSLLQSSDNHSDPFWHHVTPPLPNGKRCHDFDDRRDTNLDQDQPHVQSPVLQELRPVGLGTMTSSYSCTDHGPSGGGDETHLSEWSRLPEVVTGESDGGIRDKGDLYESSPGGQAEAAHRDNKDSNRNKGTQMGATLGWLTENYELSEGVCLPRCVLYLHYLDFCKKQGMSPSGAATFGKLIRHKFKDITTRRLGTRGQSKYHYYGIGIKETSMYYQSVYTGKGLTRFSGTKIKTEGSARKYSLSSKTGTLLPDFPTAGNLLLPDGDTAEKMATFLVMYKTHCQRIVDSVIAANFDEIQNLLLHFWQGYPTHLVSVMQLPATSDVISVCDSILYKVLIDVLVPSSIQEYPESLRTDLKTFLKNLPRWVNTAMDDVIPQQVKDVKQKALQTFLKCIKRQVTFVRIAQTTRPHLANNQVTTQATTDLDNIDFSLVCVQTRFALTHTDTGREILATSVFEELKSMLRHPSQIEAVIEWIDNLLDKYVIKGEPEPAKFRERAGNFLLHWTTMGSVVMKDMTINKALSFAFLHLLKLVMDEYIFLVLDTQADKVRDRQLKANLQARMRHAEDIPMTAVLRSLPPGRPQPSPKSKKRKVNHVAETPAIRNPSTASQPENAIICYNIDNGTHSLANRQSPSQQDPPPSSPSLTTPVTRPPAPDRLHPSTCRPIPSPHSQPIQHSLVQTIRAPSDPRRSNSLGGNDLIFRPTSQHHGLPLSPMKYYPAYDRCPYIPSLGFNSYSDYFNHHHNHTTNFHSARAPHPPPLAIQDHAQSQSIGFSPAVNQTHTVPPSYRSDNRFHPVAPIGDPYYNAYTGPYTKHLSPLLRQGFFHSDPTLDGYSRANIETFQLSGTGLDGIHGLSRSMTSSSPQDPWQPSARGDYPVTATYSVGSQGQSIVTSSTSQHTTKNVPFHYTDDAFTTNMATNSAISDLGKRYLPPTFR